MVPLIANPALEAFVAEIAEELVMAEVLVKRCQTAFRLTHRVDAGDPGLRVVSLPELRQLAQFTVSKQFRPLRSAPTLQRGWCFVATKEEELEAGLEAIYPGGIADWFAIRQGRDPVTHYRQFTGRQTGMYRVATFLSDGQAGQVARAGCDRRFCLKQRLWSVEGLKPDSVENKSMIPCLEPCAVLLEFARTAARLEQQTKRTVTLAESDIAGVLRLLENAMERPSQAREADFSREDNPRRLQLLAEKLKPVAEISEGT
jgi:hypothetical protein